MGNLMIVNGSPRAPRSNSKRYAQIAAEHFRGESGYYTVTGSDPAELCREMGRFDRLLLVFPLYVDAIPVTLLDFLKFLEAHPPQNRPVVSVLVNCGFLEPHQNDEAVEMVRLFCRQNGYPFGSVLKIGGGEAILNTPFRFLAVRKIRAFVRSVARGRCRTFSVTMPLTKGMFLAASARYWTEYGKKHGLTREQMETLEIG